MPSSTLQRKTPLKAKTGLKRNKPLTAKTTLKQYTSIKQKERLSVKQRTARKLKTPYWSIFGPMDMCHITGAKENVHPHHIFGASRKTFSEKYGFMLPLRGDWHEGTRYSIHEDRALDIKFKRACQDHWINTLQKTREEWLQECGKWW